jgi:hypothetical protein
VVAMPMREVDVLDVRGLEAQTGDVAFPGLFFGPRVEQKGVLGVAFPGSLGCSR